MYIASANMEMDGITDELDRQKEENRLQHEQIVSLTAKLAETELRLAQLMAEHDEVGATLLITKDNQNNLANELAEFKDRYAEVCTFTCCPLFFDSFYKDVRVMLRVILIRTNLM